MDLAPLKVADRSAAVENLKLLLSRGHVTAQQFADRSRAVEQATSLAELMAAVAPPSEVSLGSAAPATPTSGGPSLLRLATQQPFTGVAAGAVVRRVLGLAAVAAVGGALVFAVSTFSLTPGPAGGPTTGPRASASPKPPDLHTAAGLTGLRDAVREKFATARYLTVVIYPTYASVEVPVRGTGARSERAYYDGTFRDTQITTPRRAGSRDADLFDVDIDALVRAVREAPRVLALPDPATTYLVLDERDGRPVMSVYLSDDAGGTAYWTMRLDGRTVRTYTS